MEGNGCWVYSNHCTHPIGLVISNEYSMIEILKLCILIGIAGFAIRMWYEAFRFVIHGLTAVYRESKSDSPADKDLK